MDQKHNTFLVVLLDMLMQARNPRQSLAPAYRMQASGLITGYRLAGAISEQEAWRLRNLAANAMHHNSKRSPWPEVKPCESF